MVKAVYITQAVVGSESLPSDAVVIAVGGATASVLELGIDVSVSYTVKIASNNGVFVNQVGLIL